MKWVTPDQLKRARQIPVLAYIQAHESGNLKRVGREYRLRDHESVAVGEKGWYWHSRGIGSWSALDYLTNVRRYGLVDAVCLLLGERPQERSDRVAAPAPRAPPERPPFTLPPRNKDNRRVMAYLQSRGIDRDLIVDCIKRGVLFESRHYHNAVFLGKDEHGKTRFAAMRSTTTKFMCDAGGSDKRYGFLLPSDNPSSSEVAIFESPIDALSHQTLCKLGHMPAFDGWRLSLGGTSTLALEHLLKQYPQITHCLVCTDNDEVGNMVAAKVTEIPGITSERSSPVYGSDWNDTLQAVKKAAHIASRARDTPSL